MSLPSTLFLLVQALLVLQRGSTGQEELVCPQHLHQITQPGAAGIRLGDASTGCL